MPRRSPSCPSAPITRSPSAASTWARTRPSGVFKDLRAQWFVPMHYGAFRLSFEDMDEPPRWLRQLAQEQGLTRKLTFLEEGVPQVF